MKLPHAPFRALLLLAAGLISGVIGCSGARPLEGGAEPAASATPAAGAAATPAAGAPRYRVLVFSKTAGFRHSSIPTGVEAVRRLGQQHGFAVDATEDAAAFERENLKQYRAVVFLSTTGDVLNPAQQAAFTEYVRGGGGFVGIHAAADTEYDWPWYGELVGAYFDSHPRNQTATIQVIDRTHPATRMLPARWQRLDEWYNYRANPRGDVHVLAVLDEKSYEGGNMAPDHPIAWAHEYEGGRAFYTGLGHTEESFAEPLFLQHIHGAIEWAAGTVPGDAGATRTGSYLKTVLVEDVTDPIEMAVAPDNRLFFVERAGAVRVWHPETDSTTTAGAIPVSMTNEDGLLGVTLDPNFAENGWIYLYYSPPGPEEKNELARFTVVDDRLDMASKRVLLTVPTQRKECCHTGGSLAFGPDGSLFLSTGDNTNPFASDGYAPLDARPGREAWDSRRTSANTNDLRGKILRIRPKADGSYDIPAGNLFPPGTPGTRPEIYTMGHRNPYRITVDPETGWLYWGDVGPDAAAFQEGRGPAGHDEIGQARRAGNFGWPLFVGDNKPYWSYDFETKQSGAPFDPQRPVNDSPNNTGLRELPPAQPALIWYPYGPSEEFPAVEAGGRTAMAGPVYRYDAQRARPSALPPYFDGSLIMYEWARNWLKEVRLDEHGDVLKISPFLSDLEFIRPMDVEVGPDGALYVMEWGNEFWGNNPNARISRIDYYPAGRRPPAVAAVASVASGAAPLSVRFDAGESHSRNGDEPLEYAWDFDGDGRTDATRPDPAFTFERPGRHTARLTVTDRQGNRATTEVPVTVGNTEPAIAVESPIHGGFFEYGQPIPVRVTVTDPEDGAVRPERITVRTERGRDSHTLPLEERQGAEHSFRIEPDDEYTYSSGEYAVVDVSYTDHGAPGAAPLTGRTRILLHPKVKQAEYATEVQDALIRTSGDIRTKADFRRFVILRSGSRLAYAPVNLKGINALTFRVRPAAGGTIQVHLDRPFGRPLATLEVDSTAARRLTTAPPAGADRVETHDEAMHRLQSDPAPEGWVDLTVPVSDPGGVHTLYVTVRGEGEEPLMALDWIRFDGPGVTAGR